MEDYIVSARKYRPATFDQVVGQESLTETLKNAITSNKLAHAYLFCGPRGVGKTTCARIFAKTINCLSPLPNGEACNHCESCMAFNEQRSLNILEMDAASNNSVDDMRDLIEQVQTPPQIGKYKVYIIDEVHMLSSAAFNAFLKTLEEPPSYIIFILATTEKHKVLPTIISRCQVYDFNRMSVEQIIHHLKSVADREHIPCEEAALSLIAHKADGGMRDALSIFDQAVSFSGGNLTYAKVADNLNVLSMNYYFKLTELMLACKIPDIMLTFNDILNKGFDGCGCINGLASHFRDLLMCKDASTLPLLETSNDMKAHYQQQAAKCPVQFLYRAIKLCNECDVNYRTSQNKRLLAEITLIQIAQLTQPDADSPGSGHGPKKTLKPIFKELMAQLTTPARTASAKVEQTPAAAQRTTTGVAATASTGGRHDAQPSMAQRIIQKNQTSSTAGSKIPTMTMSQLHLNAGTNTTAASNNPGNANVAYPDTQSNGTVVAQTPAAYQTAATVQTERAYTHDELCYAWIEFINTLPHDYVALATRLRQIRPQAVSPTEFQITVLSAQVKGQVENIRNHIEGFLRRKLGNSHVTMQVHVAEQKDVRPMLNHAQQFQDMMKRNPSLQKLRGMFHLDLV